jgi:hypothetical protein
MRQKKRLPDAKLRNFNFVKKHSIFSRQILMPKHPLFGKGQGHLYLVSRDQLRDSQIKLLCYKTVQSKPVQ